MGDAYSSKPPDKEKEQPKSILRNPNFQAPKPWIRPLIPGVPGPNSPDVCRYCKYPVGEMTIPFYEDIEVTIPPRTAIPISFNVTNPESTDGYVPVYESSGLYTGGALVTNSKEYDLANTQNLPLHSDFTEFLTESTEFSTESTEFLTESTDLKSIDSTESTESPKFTEFPTEPIDLCTTEFTKPAESTESQHQTQCYHTALYRDVPKPNRYVILKELINTEHLNEEE
ncbi:hypothetical protein RF55_19524, partial [Lasius niger]